MSTKDELVRQIFRAVDDVNANLAQDQQLEKSIDAVLFGRGGKLDSLGLVSFIVAVEQQIEETFGVSITIADEKAMSQERSPFRTIGSLAEYVESLLRPEPQ